MWQFVACMQNPCVCVGVRTISYRMYNLGMQHLVECLHVPVQVRNTQAYSAAVVEARPLGMFLVVLSTQLSHGPWPMHGAWPAAPRFVSSLCSASARSPSLSDCRDLWHLMSWPSPVAQVDTPLFGFSAWCHLLESSRKQHRDSEVLVALSSEVWGGDLQFAEPHGLRT